MLCVFVLFLAAGLEFAGRALALRLGADLSVNPGVSFGLLKDAPLLALALSGLALAGLLGCVLFAARWGRRARLSLAVSAGGAAANLLQRVLSGGVADWIPLPFSTLLFENGLRCNLADLEIVLGIAIALWECHVSR